MWLKPVAKSVALAIASVLALALVLGGARLLPWVFDPRVPLGAVGVFARGLSGVAVVVSLSVGLPLGMALAAAKLGERGERLALLATGRSPLRLALASSSVSAAFAAACLGFALLAARGATTEGTARALLDSARAASSPGTPVVSIPGTDAAFLFRGGAPVFAVTAGGVALVAADIGLEGGAVVARGAEVALRGPPEVRARVGEVRVTGVDLPAHPAGVPTSRALALAALLAFATSTLAFFLLLSRGEDRPLVAAWVGTLAAVAPIVTLLA